MNTDIFEIKADKAWKSLIAESPIYLLMSNKELEKCKDFFILGYYTAIKDSYL
jgi:hypothetical protein|nr:MAG TPA: hypothetical protein [Crassvirales sp.]